MASLWIGEDGQYTGEHSISFRTMIKNGEWSDWVNTNTDWHLVPTSRPLINPPQVKTKTNDNPGGDGIFDQTESLTGFPLYGQRTGSWDFLVLNGWNEWYRLYSEILNSIHGKAVQIVLEDDPAWYYNGRVTVNQWKSDPGHSTITLDYNLDPYKLSRTLSNEDWLWDPFSFIDGIITSSYTSDLSVGGVGASGTTTITLTGEQIGRRPVTPEFIVTSGTITKIQFYNYELYGQKAYILHDNLTSADKYHWMDLILTGFSKKNKNILKITGQDAVIDIAYRMGKL